MAGFQRNYRYGSMYFDSANQNNGNLTEKLNIESISYQGGTGAFTVTDGAGLFLDEGTTTSSQEDVTHYFFGKEAVGFIVSAIPAGGIIVVQLRKGRG